MELEYWTSDQVEYVKSAYKLMGDTEIASEFTRLYPKQKGWSKKHIEKKRRYLKLKRTEEEKKLIHRRNVDLGCFSECASKSWETRGANEIGTIVTWKRANCTPVQMIKTVEGYKFLARVIWEENNGPIPSGMNVILKDKNHLNCTIDNLELLTNAELAIRNSKTRMSYPEEIRELIRLTKKLNTTIEDYGRKQSE